MKVVLMQDIKALGKKGEIKEVSDGYAANFLLPRGLVKSLTSTAANELKQNKTATDFHEQERLHFAKAEKVKLEQLTLRFAIKFGQSGKAFGSVSSKEIAEELKLKGFEVDKKKIDLKDPIKAAGNYAVKIKIHPEVTARVTIVCEKTE